MRLRSGAGRRRRSANLPSPSAATNNRPPARSRERGFPAGSMRTTAATDAGGALGSGSDGWSVGGSALAATTKSAGAWPGAGGYGSGERAGAGFGGGASVETFRLGVAAGASLLAMTGGSSGTARGKAIGSVVLGSFAAGRIGLAGGSTFMEAAAGWGGGRGRGGSGTAGFGSGRASFPEDGASTMRAGLG